MEKIITAFDFGSSHISAMAAKVLDNDKNIIEILALEEVQRKNLVQYGIPEQIEGIAFIINDFITKIQNSTKLPPVSQVFTTVNGKSMKHLPTSVTRHKVKVTQELLEDLKNECRKQFQGTDFCYDVIPIAYQLDGKTLNEDTAIDKSAHEIVAKYNAIVGTSRIQENLQQCCKIANKNLFDQNPLAVEALAEAVLTFDDCRDGCALINFGATTTTLAIYKDGALQNLLVVPLGSANVTRDIQTQGISEENAEKLKRKGVALETLVRQTLKIRVPTNNTDNENIDIKTDFLAQVIEARLDEMTAPIFRTIKDFQRQQELGAGIVLTGGGAKQNGILEFVQEKTKLYVRLGEHSEHLSENTHERFADPAYAQLVGTVLLINQKEIVEPKSVKPIKERKEPIFQKIGNLFENYFGNDKGATLE